MQVEEKMQIFSGCDCRYGGRKRSGRDRWLAGRVTGGKSLQAEEKMQIFSGCDCQRRGDRETEEIAAEDVRKPKGAPYCSE